MNLPLPSERQLSWHELEYYCFIHFTLNTFTDKEWGFGDESPQLFSPTDFDAEAMVKVVVAAGMKGLILTCKHHDGFCLWPSAFTDHSVAQSPWKQGGGDLVREVSDACKRYDIKFGVYLSPWDRNHPDYGTATYIDYFRKQLNELTTQYGDIFEVWFDGANGGDGYYGGANETRSIDRQHYYDWQNTYELVRKNQPGAVMFSDSGPDIRWVGNEKGIAGDPCWSTMNTGLLYPGVDEQSFKTKLNGDMVDAWDSPTDLLNKGDRNGGDWLPAETDVSIRPGWFYHEHEDDKVRTPENLFNLYLQSVGRGTSLLLNLPPDRRGRIHESDRDSLMGFKELRDAMYNSNSIHQGDLFADSGCVKDLISESAYLQSKENELSITCSFKEPQEIGIVGMSEYLPKGQIVQTWEIDLLSEGSWQQVASGEAVGNRRLITIENKTVDAIRVNLHGIAAPALKELAFYRNPLPQNS